MKKSLIIRWIIVLVLVLAWGYSIFPVKDKDFLTQFRAAAAPGISQLEKQARQAEDIAKKLESLKNKEGKDYKELSADWEKRALVGGMKVSEVLESWKTLEARIALLTSGKDLDGKPLPEGTRYLGYKAVEAAAKGDATHNPIRLSSFIKVPNQSYPSNKTVLRYIRNTSAGKLHLGLDLQGGTEFVVSFDEKKIPSDQRVDGIRDQILEILRNRLDKSGVTEPELKAMTETSISIRMPSVDEADNAGIRATIQEAAKLQFFLVAQNNSELVEQYNSSPSTFQTPPGLVRREMIEERRGAEVTETIFLEQNAAPVRGEDVKAAFATVNEFGQWSISLSFNTRGAQAFGEVTGANVGRRLAIVLDDTVYSAPNINQAITGGNAEITGSFTLEEANRLAGVIASGNLPVSIEIASEFGTEPKLGADSIRYGIRAGILGLILVFLFMLLYYRFCGLVADIALVVNTILVLGTMALTKATITMPGIAGMVLTIGMAVDANVLIFERMREEKNNGKNLAATVSAGFARAFSAIFDSNLTTLITCFFLYRFGSGTVQGFAVTLAFGVIASMFTALFMSHAIFDLFVHNNWLTSISMMELPFLKKTNFDFCKFMKTAIRISVVFIVIGLVGFFCRIKTVFGIDFAGGTQITFLCNGQEPDVAKVREYVNKQGYDTANVGYKVGQSGNKELEIVVPALKQDVHTFGKGLDAAFPECKMDQAGIYQVGAAVGKKFRNDAILAGVLSFLAIVLYLAFRFELMYGVAAVIALLHDVVVATGLFIVFCHGQLSLTVLAAIMTIIGYSINDTIVIFDRVRETQALKKTLTYREMINLAVNSTLSRTFLTTITTMLVTICLIIFGGGVIFDFAIVMFFGLISGTFSSLCIAPAVVLNWHKRSTQDENAERAQRQSAKI